jgi:cold shock CspA family protein
MSTGTVKWFNDEGQEVSYNVEDGPKGPQATSVTPA